MPSGNKRPLIRDTKFLGYKYTEKEKNEMTAALEAFKLKNNCSTTEAIYELFTGKKLKK